MLLNKGDSIVKLYDSVTYNGRWWIFSEPMAGTINELISYFSEHSSFAPENLIKYTAWSVLKGLTFLHENNVIHGQINCNAIAYNFLGELKL